MTRTHPALSPLRSTLAVLWLAACSDASAGPHSSAGSEPDAGSQPSTDAERPSQAPQSDAGAADAAAIASPYYSELTEPGPYPVGNVTRTLVDESRPEPYTSDAEDQRTLVTEIWYPAAASAATAEKDVFAGFLSSENDAMYMSLLTTIFGIDAMRYQALKTMPTGSVRDAAIAEGGPFPVVLFSHGNGGFRYQSTFLTEHLASHGYIVISADHTGNALLSDLPSGAVPYSAASVTNLAGRVADMSFLLDALIELDASDPDGRFLGKVDAEHVAMTGHSFGGVTTGSTVAADPRVDVGVPMAAPLLVSGLSIPLLYLVATEDQIVRTLNSAIEQNYAESLGPRWLVKVVDAGHFSFSDVCLLNPSYTESCDAPGRRLADQSTFAFLDADRVHAITVYYQTALYGYYLKGLTEYAQALAENPFAQDVLLQSADAPAPDP